MKRPQQKPQKNAAGGDFGEINMEVKDKVGVEPALSFLRMETYLALPILYRQRFLDLLVPPTSLDSLKHPELTTYKVYSHPNRCTYDLRD